MFDLFVYELAIPSTASFPWLQLGLVLVDRNTVVVGPCDVNISFGAHPMEVSGTVRWESAGWTHFQVREAGRLVGACFAHGISVMQGWTALAGSLEMHNVFMAWMFGNLWTRRTGLHMGTPHGCTRMHT